jgi:amino acid adenylation domain-containing protein
MDEFVGFPGEDLDRGIPDRLERQVRRDPCRLALVASDWRVTYEALNATANRVAHAILTRRGVAPEPIALAFGGIRSAIAAMLGVLKAGKFYVPLDAALPLERCHAILAHTGARLVITDGQHLPVAHALREREPSADVLDLDAIPPSTSMADPGTVVRGDALAYVLYTSGSTGSPKGVMQTHRNVLFKIMGQTNSFRITADDRLTLLHPWSGNGVVRHLFGALLNGATACPFSPTDEGFDGMAAWLRRREITLYHSVPTVFRALTDTLAGAPPFPALRLLYVAGDAVTRDDVERYRRHFDPRCAFVHGLASNEVGTVREFRVEAQTELPDDLVPVGYPVHGKEVLLLDEDGREVKDGEPGEIVVRSEYLSPGYWRQPELTAEKFRADPASGARRYHTGDLGVRSADGCLTYLGRRDWRVKIRGHQVDMADVERALAAHDSVKEAVVVTQDDGGSDARLVAYVVPERTPAPTVSDLQALLRAQLPAHMVPSAYRTLEALPLLPNGKVDRAALPRLVLGRPALANAFAAPSTPIEATLASIWGEALGFAEIGVHDSFLDLGGHSLLATQIVGRVRRALHVDVAPQTLLGAATVASMALLVAEALAASISPDVMGALLADADGPPRPG